MSTTPRPRKKDRHRGPQPPRPRPKTLRAPAKRSAHPLFVTLFSLRALTLPLALLSPVTPSPVTRTRFRSYYRPHSRRAIYRLFGQLKAQSSHLPSFFELALFLIDFSPLRPLLLAWTTERSARGERPFDPLSLLLACLWKIAAHLSWEQAAADLAHPQKGTLWRSLCGFRRGDTPSESALRAFRERFFPGLFNYVQKLFLAALHRAGLLPPLEEMHGYLLASDGQLHQARSQHCCQHATAACFQPAPRPCPLREKKGGQAGCACDTPACQAACLLAPRRDPQASLIVYSHREKKEGQTTIVLRDKVVFGYRSQATRLVDPRFHCAWNVSSDLFTAKADEGVHFPGHFRAAYRNLPQKEIGYVLYDSACGEKPCLEAVYDLGGIPLFDLKADPSDKDPSEWTKRGYDDRGHPLCLHGFPMTYQGIDRSRKAPRARWVCAHACRNSPAGPVPACPYLEKRRGQYIYVERALPGGCYRLARLVPYGTPKWNKLTAWRNTSEGRNSHLEACDLLRFPDYGLLHGAFLVLGADVVENLCTLARLVYEATLLDPAFHLWLEAPDEGTPTTSLPPGPACPLESAPGQEMPPCT